MDPTTNLNEQIALAVKLQRLRLRQHHHYLNDFEADVERLCELVIDLHDWIRKGGHLPTQ